MDASRVRVLRKREAAAECAVEAFDTMGLFTRDVFLVPALALDREHTFVQAHLDVFPPEARKLRPQQILVLRLLDVDDGRPLDLHSRFFTQELRPPVEHRSGEIPEELICFPEGFPTHEVHDFLLHPTIGTTLPINRNCRGVQQGFNT
jgi:hypothetical protein